MARREWPLLILLLGVGLAYARTLAPSVTTEDSGELIAAAAVGGVPHPPGFPLYCLLVRGLIAVCPCTPARAGNIASALFALMALGALYAALRALSVRPVIAAASAALFGLGRTFWSQAIIAEVYTLNAALLATSIALLAWASTQPPERARKGLYGAVAVAGLGLANHWPLMGLAAPGLALYAVRTQRPAFTRLRTWATCGVALVPGLALYAYLPCAARRKPPVNWGDPAESDQFWAHVTRKAYRELERGGEADWSDKLAFLQHAAELAAVEWGPGLLLGLIALGAWAAWARRDEGALVVGLWLGNPLLLLLLLRFRFEGDHILRVNEYYLPVYLGAALLAGLGLERASRRWQGVPWVAALACAAPVLAHAGAVDRSSDWLAEDFNRALLESLEPNAVFFPSGDYVAFPSLYLTAAEGVRPDVLLANYTGKPAAAAVELATSLDPTLDPDERGEVQRALIERSGRPVYFAAKSDVRVAGLRLRPWGLVYWVEGTGPAPERSAPSVEVSSILRNVAAEENEPDDLGRSLLADAYRMEGEHALLRGSRDAGLASFSTAASWHRRPGAEARADKEGLNNLGSTLAEYGEDARAEALFREAAAQSATYLTPRRNLAQLMDRTGRREAAREAYRAILEVEPEDAEASARLRALEAPARDGAMAKVRELEQVVAAQPGNAASWNNLGSAWAEAGGADEARRAFERALALDPSYALPHRNLAILYETALGDGARAAYHRERFDALRETQPR